MSQLDIADELFCPGCGYSLRGIESQRCPECGLVIDHELIRRSIIPWSYRKQIGRWRAFLRTVWFILRNPRGIGREVMRPVSYRDAQSFRWLVVLAAWAPLAIMLLIARGWIGDMPGPVPWAFQWRPGRLTILNQLGMCIWVGAFTWLTPSIALFLLLAGMSGTAAYFFHPRSLPVSRQNRAIAISFYACAPLALLWFPCALLLGAAIVNDLNWFGNLQQFQIMVVLLIIGWTGVIAVPAFCWFRALHLLHVTTQCSASRLIAAAVMLPLIWIVLVILTLMAFPALCGLIRLMIFTWTS